MRLCETYNIKEILRSQKPTHKSIVGDLDNQPHSLRETTAHYYSHVVTKTV